MMSESSRPREPGRREPPGERPARRLLPRLVLLALLAIVVAGGVRAVAQRLQAGTDSVGGLVIADDAAVDSAVDHRAVEFSGELLASGQQWSSRSARGAVLVVNFWASWCGPCRAEQPELSKVARAYADRGVRFVGVNIKDNRATAQSYVREFDIPYPSLFDPAAQVAAELRLVALPTTFVLDRDGVLAYQLTGKVSEEVLRVRLERLLGNGGRPAGEASTSGKG